MTSLLALREGLAARLATIDGLRASAFFTEALIPPMAIVGGPDIDYDAALGRMADDYEFPIIVLAGFPDARVAYLTLDGMIDSSGSSSIKAAIEADGTLGGIADFCTVTTMRDYGVIELGGTRYLSATFTVQVAAAG